MGSVVFFHPDLGIGGAERLVIDAAVGLQQRGHKVTIFTSHCDPSHCFEEARDGTLDVRVRGNALIPQTVLGRLWIVCAILRQLHLILQISLFSDELDKLSPRAFFIDQLSAGIPLLRSLKPSVPVLFYCHFPDKLLVQKRGGIRAVYRWPFDWLESWSTGCANRIVVNSKFTQGVFKEAFPRLADITPGVVYPAVDTSREEGQTSERLWEGKRFFLSVNRFERKKDVGLAIRAFAALSPATRKTSRLVIAGGFDPRNAENSSYLGELEALSDSLKLQHATVRTPPTALALPGSIDVVFLLSVPSSFKETLLSSADLLIYTPRNEHFGIVPLEAMLAGTPVLAANEGGPVETVLDGTTGWLRDARDVRAWTGVIEEAVSAGEDQLTHMGAAGRRRVKEQFSKTRLAAALESEIAGMGGGARKSGSPPLGSPLRSVPLLFVALAIAVLASALLLKKFLP